MTQILGRKLCSFALALSFVLAASLVPGGAAAPTEFEQGVKLYSQRDYKQAFKIFNGIYLSDQNNMTALFYCANCQLASGQKEDAIKAYQAIVDHKSGTAVAFAAQNALRSVNASSASTALAAAATSSSTSTGSIKATPAQTSAAIVARKYGPLSSDQKKQAINEIVQTVRAQADRPNVSTDLVAEIKEALLQYPEPLLHRLWKKGLHIKVTPTMVDNDPSLGYKQPRGYEDGTTYKNCPGLFNGYDIVLCEYEFIGDSPDLRKCLAPLGTLRHELGHAVDGYLGRITSQEEFKHLYLLDLGTMDDETKNHLSYYTQKDRAGPSETFAEIMCYKFGGRPPGDPRKPEDVANAFKLSHAYIDKLIAAIPAN